MEEVKFKLGLEGRVGISQVTLGRGISKGHETGKF